ncbi:BadF/BadG/BcrA/BcrD ATPase family protein [Streptomyces sp. DSM 44915]|uniref:BadF/BadG/BcrA/BcrD ATPase family protein n=1 Tax=Streptomyces chisholmiae TaxID=3075540 RepID=A0ABU2JMM6_9ACTN|nr:BadF/BadG/BcrA/BcrD ATPase family protein [Streptomyces sp. DSM 44915]MDT0265944.1 BadF/BadG/BcrA/BcrD ATPase family protein [Streptomyces sp. DSM 44915]
MTAGPAGGAAWVLGVDSGGSGLRVALARATPDGVEPPAGERRTAEPVRTGPGGIDAGHLLAQLLPAARALLDEAAPAARIDAVCVGAAGMATLGGRLRAELPEALAAGLGARRLALAADAVTGYAGALGEAPGAVVAAGTGMIALGTELRAWRRADGWGHLLGDCGGGAWIGQRGLAAALREHDGRSGGSAALLARAEAAFGPMPGLPSRLYPRADRPAVLASFAPEVARCATAAEPDPVAVGILAAAAAEIAETVAAVYPTAVEPSAGPGRVALTGGLFRLGEPLTGPLAGELARRLPAAEVVPAAGSPLDGALLLAGRLAFGGSRLPADPGLLHLVGERG